ncbi:MAG: hypothetical protein ACJ8F1_15050, partial [Polyangia bacterium]
MLQLSGCESLAAAKPGQFVMIRGAWGRDPLLPRAFSLMSAGPGDTAEILAKTVGRGTALLERALPGAELDVLGPLGNNFPDPVAGTTDLLVAGGVGLPPLYMQAAHGAARGQIAQFEMIYGGRRAVDLVLLREMEAMRLPLFLATETGGLAFRNPVLTASGTFGYAKEFESLTDLGALGGVVTKGISPKPRFGNHTPRICETASGMLNSIGLENVGVEGFER